MAVSEEVVVTMGVEMAVLEIVVEKRRTLPCGSERRALPHSPALPSQTDTTNPALSPQTDTNPALSSFAFTDRHKPNFTLTTVLPSH
ncbi:hypothetical protein Pmani_037322 [Petrolisthes manimaculis]|uniref:Uncharacterized protein n=1 Tax=Petrolisthes manimaculis TaxID=1843537 RepID=A0AAE1NIG6_9EUCA|nr:hypothetical protein Pmani_037322 [Petrolisthes manimaculis]